MSNWIWLHPKPGEDDETWKRRFGRFREADIGGALTCVSNGREGLYRSGHLPVGAPLLDDLLPLAEAEGIALHAWIVTLRCNVPGVQASHPDWYSVSRNGASSLDRPPYIPSYQWLCPTRPEVVEFVRATVTELAEYGELGGIHLDYIRHPDVILPEALQPKYDLVQDREYPEFDFCYCEVCREAFREQTGVDVLEMDDPTSDDAWREFRFEGIRQMVSAAAEEVRARGKQVSAAVFATPDLARTYVRQDWPSWDLDAVFPMIYHQYYARPEPWIGSATREGVEALAGRFPLYSGLFIPALDVGALQEAVDLALENGAQGVCFFSYGAMTEAHWESLGKA
ncbi:MAG: putative glycoside hydrolase [Candidatus Latescibacteria bacterium]|jgi:uncharacterized lipoprotein YddW (UPF0748 family)|nr:putative glycoside hydrolase [Candidatus Latescibacterota bacterium]